ncbi:MAG: hypothetical protein WKG07_32150 [Hymenobacter sp.]
MLHRGGDWTTTPTINPGETVDVRLEGESLLKGRYYLMGRTSCRRTRPRALKKP